MRRTLAVAVLAAALGAAGTAVAIPRGVPARPQAHESEFARSLAQHLDGVSAAQIQQALRRVREQRMAEHRARVARALAQRLDVSTDAAERALETAHRELRASFARGRRPQPGAFVATLARELDRTPAQVRQALQAVRRQGPPRCHHPGPAGGGPGPHRGPA